MATTNEITCPERLDQRSTEKPDFAVSFDAVLAPGDTLASATAVELTTSDLTITSVAVSAAELTISNQTVAIGRAVTFFVTGGTPGADGNDYTIRVQGTATSGAIRECDCNLRVIP